MGKLIFPPSALRTYEGSKLAEVHADPEETAIDLRAIIRDSPSTKLKDIFNMPGNLFLNLH